MVSSVRLDAIAPCRLANDAVSIIFNAPTLTDSVESPGVRQEPHQRKNPLPLLPLYVGMIAVNLLVEPNTPP
jgi:hypothetical protein